MRESERFTNLATLLILAKNARNEPAECEIVGEINRLSRKEKLQIGEKLSESRLGCYLCKKDKEALGMGRGEQRESIPSPEQWGCWD